MAWYPRRAFRAAIPLSLFVAACASGRGAAPAAELRLAESVIIDGRPVPAEGKDLLNLIRLRVSPSRLGAFGTDSAAEPLLIIDGVTALGTSRTLSEIPATTVAQVITLRPIDAFSRYGTRARYGAIIVRMRGG